MRGIHRRSKLAIMAIAFASALSIQGMVVAPNAYADVPVDGVRVDGNLEDETTSAPATEDDAVVVNEMTLAPASDALESGTWGTCEWEIGSDHVLRVHAGTGDSSNSPWAENTSFDTVVFDEGVNMPRVCDGLFEGCKRLVSLVAPSLDTSSVTSMSGMFRECTKLETVDTSSWDTSNVRNMNGMFYGCSKLVTVDVSGWDTSSVEDMGCMFYGCSMLETIDVTDWDTSSVEDMGSMYCECSALESLDVASWNMSSVTYMDCMFYECMSLETLDVSRWDTSHVTSMYMMFYQNWYHRPPIRELNVSDWDTSSVTNMSKMFYCMSNLETLDVSGWDTSHVTDMMFMFGDCTSLTTLDVSGWNTSSVTEPDFMFEGCLSLKNLDVSGWNTSNMKSMRCMFSGCSSLVALDVSGWNTTGIVDMSEMFSGCSSLKSLDVSGWGWDMSSVEAAYGMFSGCSSLETLDVSGWDTSSMTMLFGMFRDCSSLEELDVSGWDVRSVGIANYADMFEGCSSLKSIDLSHWDNYDQFYPILAVPSGVNNNIFDGCASLEAITVGERFVTCRSESEIRYTGWLFPQSSNPDGWWSKRDGRWLTNEEAMCRPGIADTYTTYQNGVGKLSDAVVSIENQTFTGSVIAPSPKVMFGSKTLVAGTDYELTCSNNVNVGTVTVTITGKGNYEGTITTNFKILPKAQTIAASDKSVAMGKTLSLRAKVTEGGGALSYRSSNESVAKVSASGVVTPVKAGRATITITAKATGSYKSTSKTVKVVVTKGAQPMSAKGKTAAVKLSKAKQSKQVLKVGKVLSVNKAQGRLSYAKTSGGKMVSVNKKTGAVTIAKGTKKGTYKLKIKVIASGNANWKAGSKTVSVTITVK